DELEEEAVLVEVEVLAENDDVVLDVGAEELVELVVKLELVLAVVEESEFADVELLEKILDNEVLVDDVLVELIDQPDVEDDVAELLEDVVELVDVVVDGMGELRVVDVAEDVELPVVELDELEDVELKDVSVLLVVEVMLLLLCVHASADDVDVPLELVVVLVGVPMLSLVLLVLVVWTLELVVLVPDVKDEEDELLLLLLVVDVLEEEPLVDVNVLPVVVRNVDEGAVALVVNEVDVDELDVALEDNFGEAVVLGLLVFVRDSVVLVLLTVGTAVDVNVPVEVDDDFVTELL
ncbi:unnamed protein product, partial [Symbiodinium pilosum]